MNSMKWQNDRILKEELPRSVGAQHPTGDQWRNNSRKNEGMVARVLEWGAIAFSAVTEEGVYKTISKAFFFFFFLRKDCVSELFGETRSGISPRVVVIFLLKISVQRLLVLSYDFKYKVCLLIAYSF